jgi:hypothetical protein
MTAGKLKTRNKTLAVLIAVLMLSIVGFGLAPSMATAGQAVLTRSYDNARSGANINELSFTPWAIRAQGLRKVFSLTMSGDDPRVEAQPLKY